MPLPPAMKPPSVTVHVQMPLPSAMMPPPVTVHAEDIQQCLAGMQDMLLSCTATLLQQELSQLRRCLGNDFRDMLKEHKLAIEQVVQNSVKPMVTENGMCTNNNNGNNHLCQEAAILMVRQQLHGPASLTARRSPEHGADDLAIAATSAEKLSPSPPMLPFANPEPEGLPSDEMSHCIAMPTMLPFAIHEPEGLPSDEMSHCTAMEKRSLRHSLTRSQTQNREVDLKPRKTKKQIKRQLLKGKVAKIDTIDLYAVENFYHQEGYMQQIARSDWFSYLTLLVISMNAVYIGVSEDWNKSDTLLESDLVFQLFDHFFCGCFTLELIVRFCAFRHKSDALRDNWFKFDALLVLLSIFDTWLMTAILAITNAQTVALPTVGSALKLLRLLRLSRLVRLVRCLPELLTLINGMREGARAVGSSLLLVAILIYMFGIVMHMFLSSNEELADRFGTLSLCMWTLLLDGALTSETKPTLEALLSEEEHAMVFIFLFFVFLSCLTVMNMLIGVLCEVVSVVKQLEEQTAAHELVKGTVLVLLKQLDVDESGDISKEEMANVMEHEQARACLQDLN
ncbi:unnamed protein product, partial [Polarella glacialis]